MSDMAIQRITAKARRLHHHWHHVSLSYREAGRCQEAEVINRVACDISSIIRSLEDHHRDLTCGPDGKQGVDTQGNP